MSKALPDIDFRHLSEIHSERPEFITLYLNTPDRQFERTFIENRQAEIQAVLGPYPGLRKALDGEVNRIITRIEEKGVRGEALAVFACAPEDVFEFHELPVPMKENMLVLDSSPYIKPLAFLYEEYEHFLIVMVDSRNGIIHSVAGTIRDSASLHKDIMRHHRKGGWSQMRYQRIREGNILHLYKEIAEKVTSIAGSDEAVHRIVLAGPKDAKKKFYEQLPKHIQDMVIGYANVSMKASHEEVLDEAYEIFFAEEQKEETERMERLRSEIFRGGLATVGPHETVIALRNGRVHILLLDPDATGGGWKCESCGIWGFGSKKNCPDCASEVFQVDVFEEAVEEAEKKDTGVEFIKDDDFLQSIGGMAAILRW